MNPLLQNRQTSLQSQFDQFKRTIQGNPQSIVQDLLSSGKMSQEQFRQLSQQAELFSKLLK